jgi:hypothetical protein
MRPTQSAVNVFCIKQTVKSYPTYFPTNLQRHIFEFISNFFLFCSRLKRVETFLEFL